MPAARDVIPRPTCESDHVGTRGGYYSFPCGLVFNSLSTRGLVDCARPVRHAHARSEMADVYSSDSPLHPPAGYTKESFSLSTFTDPVRD